MTPDRHRQICELFQRAAGLSETDRAALLDLACAGDKELRREVESLLRHHHDERDGFHEENVGIGRRLIGDEGQAAGFSAELPERIGRFRILRRLGEGGMGVVFEATQDNPTRTIALKVIRAGAVSDSLVRRFRHEAEVLARLQHPGIADVYEAGVAETPLGRQPYFAMQLIAGRSLLDHATSAVLDWRARLELFARICDAVQYAHQRGVIHRDIKPANIVIDAAGQPKILDFGVARVTEGDLTIASMQTADGQVIGTLPYMSPEQVSGRAADVDTRSDVYSLGITLYELLTGRLPYDVSNRPLPEAARVIVEVEPTRISTIDQRFPGDVETIVMKAIQKDREQRYASAAELAADIRRCLADEPVLARPPSAMYQLRKFAKRNRVLVGSALAVCASLLMGIAGVLWFAAGESRQRATAEAVSSESRRLAYRVSVGAAADAISEHNLPSARRLLNEAPPELRGWEWRHLIASLDGSVARMALDQPAGGWLHPRADGTLLHRGLSRVVHVDPLAERVIATFEPPAGLPIAVDSRASTIAYPLDGTHVRLHDIDTGRGETIELAGDAAASGKIATVVFSGDSSLLGLVRSGGALALYDLREHRTRWTTRSSIIEPVDMTISPNNRWLALSSYQGYAIFDAHDGRPTAESRRSTSPRFTRTAWSPDDEILYRRDWNDDRTENFVEPIRAATGEKLPHWSSHDRELSNIELSADGSVAIVTSADGLVRINNAVTGGVVLELQSERAASGAIFTPDEKAIIFCELNGIIRVVDRFTGRRVGSLHGLESAGVIAFSCDGRQFLARGGDGALRVWEFTKSGDRNVLRGHTRYVYPVAFSPDGATLATGGWDQTIRLWDVRERREVRALTNLENPVLWLRYGPDGRHLLSLELTSNRQLLWSLDTGDAVQLPPRDPASGNDAAFIDSGKRIWLPGPIGETERVWNIDTGQVETVPWTHLGRIDAQYASPRGDWVARFTGNPPHVTLVSTRDARVTKSLDTLAFRATFSPDGKTVVTTPIAPADMFTVWDVATGHKLHELRGHIGELYDARFAPDGTRLATCGRDGTIRIWETERFESLVRLRGHDDYVWSLAWSPDGEMLASGSGDFTARLWPGRRD